MKKVNLSLSLTSIILFSFLILTSCSKESTSERMTVFEGRDHIITYDYDDSHINIFVDSFKDTTDATDGTWPDIDIMSIYFDKNNNGILDPGIDFLLGSTENSQICYATLISDVSTSGCSFFDNLTGDTMFGPTENLSQDHVHFNLSIPKSFFSDESKVNFYVRLIDSNTGQDYLPSSPPSFASTFEITW